MPGNLEPWLDVFSPAVTLGAGLAGVLLLQNRLPLPVERSAPLGVALLGIALAAAFSDMLLTGRVPLLRFFSKEFGGRQDRPGRLLALLLVVVGVLVGLGGLLEWLQPGVVDRVVLARGPGQDLAVTLAGFCLGLLAAVYLWGWYKGSDSLRSALIGLPQALFGLLLLLLALALLAFGLTRLLAPNLIDQWLGQLMGFLPVVEGARKAVAMLARL